MQTAPECSRTCAPAPTSLSLRADFHAKTFHAREKARGYAEREADFGRSTRVSFARFDPVSFSWKIPHFLFQEGWDEYSQTWPRYGMMVRGECYQLPPWARDTGATVFGELSAEEMNLEVFCTPTTVEAKPSAKSWHKNRTLGDVVADERAAESATGPTPTTIGLDGGSNSRRAARARGRYIEGAGALSATGPTPQANDAKHGMGENREGHQIMLIHAIRDRAAAPSAPWPTPCATDHKGAGKEGTFRDRLDYAVERGKTKSHDYPTVGTKTMGGCSGSFAKLKHLEEIGRQTPEERRAMSSHLTGGKDPDTANCGMLNPDWVEWLMGWPIGWTDIDDGGELLWLELDDDPAEWEPPLIHRITRKKKHRVKRIETLGNGQVPLCAAVAFAFGFEIVRVVIEGRSAA